MGLKEYSDKEADLLALMFVRALMVGRKNNYIGKDGKGPSHCPVVIYEDEWWYDSEVMEDKWVDEKDNK